jgi:hypothetical protein
MRILFNFSIFLFLIYPIQAGPSADYSCDSGIVREILDQNGLDTVAVSAVTGGNKIRIDTLDLTGREIAILPGSIGDLNGLKCLLLGCRRFSGIPHDPICNTLDSLPVEIGKLTELVSLGLDGNRLVTLPSSIAELKKLKYLNVEYNKFASLPAVIGDLTELESLKLGYNPLTSVPDEIGHLGKLRYMSLYATDIQQLPNTIGNCGNLEIVIIANTGLTSLPDEFCNLSALKQAELYRNKLASLPDSIVKLNNLEYFFVEYNRLCLVPDNIKAWLDKNDAGWRETQDCDGTKSVLGNRRRTQSTVPAWIKSLPGFIEISYSLSRSGSVKIEAFDVQGRLLFAANEDNKAAGIHTLRLRTAGKSKGLVFVRITGDFDNKKGCYFGSTVHGSTFGRTGRSNR